MPQQWGRSLGSKPDYIVTAEQRMWTVIMAIADGGDVVDQLRLLVAYCSPDMDRLAFEASGVQGYFGNEPLAIQADVHELGAPEPDESVEARSQPESTGLTMEDTMDVDNAGIAFDDGYLGNEFAASGVSDAGEQNLVVGDSLQHNIDIQEPKAGGVPSFPGSPLTIPSDSEESSEDEDDVQDNESPTSAPAPAPVEKLKFSTRVIKPPKIFTSGATLTQPSTKKRKMEREALPEMSEADVPMSPETLFWNSTFNFYSAAVSAWRHAPLPTKCSNLTTGCRCQRISTRA